MNKARIRLKWLLYPGVNLHARLRYTTFPQRFTPPDANAPRPRFLDAGCGNGMLTYRAYQRGYDAVGVNFNPSETARCSQLFNGFLRLPEEHLRFEVGNLHDISKQGWSFDEAVCSEVIEHIRDDANVCKQLHDVLRPGAMLHICTPNADHPYNASFPLDPDERGGHVRPGYTLETLSQLLEGAGFRVVEHGGLGGPIRQYFNARIKRTQERHGPAWGFPLFLTSLLFTWLDPRKPPTPFSIYIKAMKPSTGSNQKQP